MIKLNNPIVIFFGLLIAQVAAHAHSSNDEDTSALETTQGTVKVKLEVRHIAPKNCFASASWRWGAEGACPSYSPTSMTVIAGGQHIYVPLSAFFDLGNPRSIQLKTRKEHGWFTIVIQGGEASTSYKAILEFDKNQVVERVVRHGEFPEESWEKTTYKFNM